MDPLGVGLFGEPVNQIDKLVFVNSAVVCFRQDPLCSSLSLAGAATSITFVATNTCYKYKTRVVATNDVFCRDKSDTCGSSRQ